MSLNNIDKAIDYYRIALEIYSIRNNLVAAYIRENKVDDSIRYYMKDHLNGSEHLLNNWPSFDCDYIGPLGDA